MKRTVFYLGVLALFMFGTIVSYQKLFLPEEINWDKPQIYDDGIEREEEEFDEDKFKKKLVRDYGS